MCIRDRGEGEEATEVPVMGYKIILTANGSGTGTGIEVAETAEEVVVYAQAVSYTHLSG